MLECLSDAFLNLCEGSGGIVPFCRLETLMAENMLYLLHLKAMLVKQGTTSVPGQMPV